MLENILSHVIYYNEVRSYLLTFSIFASIVILSQLLIGVFVLTILKRETTESNAHTRTFAAHIIQRSVLPIIFLAAFYIALRRIYLPENIMRWTSIILFFILAFFAVRLVTTSIQFALKRMLSEEIADSARVKGITPALNIIVWAVAIALVLENVGIEMSAIIAGFGIGGIAIALAAQAFLGDLFSYYSILIDRPFEIGDFLIVGDALGVVEKIGIKTTHIRSLGGELLIFSNQDLGSSRIKNYKSMRRRRIAFSVGVTYDCSLKNMKAIPGIIKEIIESTEGITFDRSHFKAYGDFSLIFETVYYVETGDYNVYMDKQQEINIRIKEAFIKRNITFAFPTQTIELKRL